MTKYRVFISGTEGVMDVKEDWKEIGFEHKLGDVVNVEHFGNQFTCVDDVEVEGSRVFVFRR